MILFIGLLSDPAMTHALAVAERREIPFTFFDLQPFMLEGDYFWDFAKGEGYIRNNEITINFPQCEITGIYSRPISLINLLDEKQRPAAAARMNAVIEILNSIPVLTVNRPRTDYSNSAKLYHLHLLKQCGFRIPASLLTNDEAEAKRFIESHERVIYKGASSEKTIVSLYDNKLAGRLKWLGNSPVLFQEYVAGADIRAHLVGSSFFAEKIECNGIDYRYETETNRFSQIDLPPLLTERCLRYRDVSGLHFIGFDFKLTPEGDYIIMEANPMPGYNSYDRRAGLQISDALLTMLSGERSAVLSR
ncbi:RimK family alpha-L-glutamate ligase [Paenibacillus tarimensis]